MSKSPKEQLNKVWPVIFIAFVIGLVAVAAITWYFTTQDNDSQIRTLQQRIMDINKTHVIILYNGDKQLKL